MNNLFLFKRAGFVCWFGILAFGLTFQIGCGDQNAGDKSPVPPANMTTRPTQGPSDIGDSTGAAPSSVTGRTQRRPPGVGMATFGPPSVGGSFVSPTLSWTQFRGHRSQAVTASGSIPTEWSADSGLLWRTSLPGRGASGLITRGNVAFVTAASGYGMSSDDPGDVANLKLHLICLNVVNGRYVWERTFRGSGLTQSLTPDVLRHGFATSTPVIDQERVYAFFGATGVVCCDLNGELQWTADVGYGSNTYGTAASLILNDDLLIVNASIENETVYAIDKTTGQGVWKIDDVRESFATPVIGQNVYGENELVILDKGRVRGFSPETGEEFWRCEGIDDQVVSTPLIKNGVCYCSGGSSKKMMAIQLGGRGDVESSNKIWEVPIGSEVASPIYLSGQLYAVTGEGILQCIDARTGELLSKKRLPTKRTTFASPLYSDNRLFIPLKDNGVFVCEATSKFETICHNIIEGDDNPLMAGLAASSSRLFLRNDQYVYAFESEANSAGLKNEWPANGAEIETEPRFEEVKGRKFGRFLNRDLALATKAILDSFGGELDESKKSAVNERVTKSAGEFSELRDRQKIAYWEYLKSGSEYRDQLESELKEIEKETLSLVEKIREESYE